MNLTVTFKNGNSYIYENLEELKLNKTKSEHKIESYFGIAQHK